MDQDREETIEEYIQRMERCIELLDEMSDKEFCRIMKHHYVGNLVAAKLARDLKQDEEHGTTTRR